MQVKRKNILALKALFISKTNYGWYFGDKKLFQLEKTGSIDENFISLGNLKTKHHFRN